MARLLLVRHGESEWNALRKWQGWADPALTADGERQARDAAERLAGMGLRSLVSSDLQRARRTAEILGEELELPGPRVDPDLKERDVGDWSGHTADEIEVRWPGVLADWRRGHVRNPPNGESNEHLLERLRRGIARAATECEAPVLVVTHGGVIRVLERFAGERSHGVPNLGGRWFEWRGAELHAGEIVTPVVAEAQGEATIL